MDPVVGHQVVFTPQRLQLLTRLLVGPSRQIGFQLHNSQPCIASIQLVVDAL